MNITLHDEHGDPVKFGIIWDIDAKRRERWTFRFIFKNHFETVVKLDRYEVKAMLSMLIESL